MGFGMSEQDYLNAVQAAAYLGVDRTRIYQLKNAGLIGRQIGGYWVFTKEELEHYKQQPKKKGGRPRKTTRQ